MAETSTTNTITTTLPDIGEEMAETSSGEREAHQVSPAYERSRLFSAEADQDCLLQLMKSHVYSALGAAMYLETNFIIWTELDIEEIKRESKAGGYWKRKATQRLYYGGNIKDRLYVYNQHHYKLQSQCFGLSPAFQKQKPRYPLTEEETTWYHKRSMNIGYLHVGEQRVLCLWIDHARARENHVQMEDFLEMEEDDCHPSSGPEPPRPRAA